MAKGFKKRYFSLAAIAATVSLVQLQATASSVVDHERHIVQSSDEESDDETAELENVVVESALPSASSLKNLTSDITVITSDELQAKHYTNLLDALKHQSSLFVTQNGGPGQSSGFFVRGMSSEHLLVMIDGVRLNDPTSTKGQAALEHLTLTDVKQIEIVKGAQSGVWGADASGGVINIVTKDTPQGLHVDGHLMGGSYTTQNGALNVGYGNERIALQAGWEGYKTDGFPPKKSSTFDGDYIDRTYYLKAALRPTDRTRLDASFRQIVADESYEGSNPTTFLPEKQHGAAKTSIYRVAINHRIGSWVLKAYGDGTDFKRVYNGKAYKGDTRMAGAGIDYRLANALYTFGYDYRKDTMDRSYGVALDSSIKDNALYGAFTIGVLQNRLVANASLRYDRYDAYDDKTTGKVGLKYRFSQLASYIAANVGTGYRAPSLYERFGGDGYTAPNADLSPESTTTYDVTLAGWGMKATYFYNRVTDLIDYAFGAYLSPGHYYNVEGASKLQGVELSYFRAIDSLDSSLGLSYQYLDAKDASDTRLLRRPRHKATADWTTYLSEAFSVDFNVVYAADYLDDDYSTYPATRVQMGSYLLCNAIVDYDVAKKGGFYLKWNNIFNEDYQTVYGYNTERSSVYVGWRFHY